MRRVRLEPNFTSNAPAICAQIAKRRPVHVQSRSIWIYFANQNLLQNCQSAYSQIEESILGSSANRATKNRAAIVAASSKFASSAEKPIMQLISHLTTEHVQHLNRIKSEQERIVSKLCKFYAPSSPKSARNWMRLLTAQLLMTTW